MFDAKIKEPNLSEEMQNIIYKSIGEKVSSNYDEIYRVKYKIMKTLTEDNDVLNTLHNKDLMQNDGILNGDAYRNVCIFDYLKLPDLKSNVRNYICFEVNENGWGEMTDKTIVFRCVSHVEDIETDWGISRQDLLAAIIKNKFDWTNAFGMRWIKESDTGRITDDGYHYREVVYRSNSPLNTYKKNHQY